METFLSFLFKRNRMAPVLAPLRLPWGYEARLFCSKKFSNCCNRQGSIHQRTTTIYGIVKGPCTVSLGSCIFEAIIGILHSLGSFLKRDSIYPLQSCNFGKDSRALTSKLLTIGFDFVGPAPKQFFPFRRFVRVCSSLSDAIVDLFFLGGGGEREGAKLWSGGLAPSWLVVLYCMNLRIGRTKPDRNRTWRWKTV